MLFWISNLLFVIPQYTDASILLSETSLVVCEEEPSGEICGELNVPAGGLACDITVRWQFTSGNASKSHLYNHF